MISFPFIILGMRSGRPHGLIPIHHPRNEDVHIFLSLIGLNLPLGNKVYNKPIKVATLVTPVAPNGVKWRTSFHCTLILAHNKFLDLVFYCH